MRRRCLIASSLAAVAASLSPNPLRAATPAKVVATFSVLGDMVRSVGGSDVALTTLVPPDADAHTYQPRPSDLRTLQTADALVENGLGLEGFISRMAKSSGFRGVRVVASAGVVPRNLREGGRTLRDPHAWQDPRNGVLYVRAIADGLVRVMPQARDELRGRADAAIADIEAADRFVEQTLAPVPPERRRIITSHDAFGYFAARYNIEMIGVQGISTESEPSARDVAKLVAQVKRERIRAVFVENMTDGRLADMLARESGAVVGGKVYSDALSPPDGPAATYVAMLRHNATLFAKAMGA